MAVPFIWLPSALAGVRGIPPLFPRSPHRLLHVGRRPVGTQRTQQQPRHDALPLFQVGKGAQKGDDGIGAGIEQVVVPEHPQRRVLGALRREVYGPGLLSLPESQGVLFRNHLPDAGLRVVGGDLLPHDLIVEAARHQGHSIRVPGQLQREGFGRGYGLEQVLHSQQGPFPRPGRRHRQQDRRGLPCTASGQGFRQVEFHLLFLFSFSGGVLDIHSVDLYLRWYPGHPFNVLPLVSDVPASTR